MCVKVLVDGNDIKTLNLRWLREHLGIVSQEPVLFSGTVKDNITMGMEDATESEILRAAKLANADEFIAKLPEASLALGKRFQKDP